MPTPDTGTVLCRRRLAWGSGPRRPLLFPPPKDGGATSVLDLSCVLEPLLIVSRLLPPLVSLAGANEVDFSAQVLAVLSGAIAGTVGAEAEILGRELLRRIHLLGEKIASLITDAAFLGIGGPRPPEPFPIR